MNNLLVLALTALVFAPADIHVVDGDTIWADGVKYRFVGVDTPEPTKYGNARCAEEARLGDYATEYVTDRIANAQEIKITPNGLGYYGRTLAEIEVDSEDLIAELIMEGVGQPYLGRKGNWCD